MGAAPAPPPNLPGWMIRVEFGVLFRTGPSFGVTAQGDPFFGWRGYWQAGLSIKSLSPINVELLEAPNIAPGVHLQGFAGATANVGAIGAQGGGRVGLHIGPGGGSTSFVPTVDGGGKLHGPPRSAASGSVRSGGEGFVVIDKGPEVPMTSLDVEGPERPFAGPNERWQSIYNEHYQNRYGL